MSVDVSHDFSINNTLQETSFNKYKCIHCNKSEYCVFHCMFLVVVVIKDDGMLWVWHYQLPSRGTIRMKSDATGFALEPELMVMRHFCLHPHARFKQQYYRREDVQTNRTRRRRPIEYVGAQSDIVEVMIFDELPGLGPNIEARRDSGDNKRYDCVDADGNSITFIIPKGPPYMSCDLLANTLVFFSQSTFHKIMFS